MRRGLGSNPWLQDYSESWIYLDWELARGGGLVGDGTSKDFKWNVYPAQRKLHLVPNMANHVTKTNLHYKSMWVNTMRPHNKSMVLALFLGEKS